jgi:hypothetical protein
MTPPSIEPQQEQPPPAESPPPASAEPRQREASRRERPEAGSLLFPDLVWAHYVWQSRARPHRFRTVRVVTKGRMRRILLWTRRNHPPSSQNGAIPTPADARRSASELKQDYEAALASFQDAEGEIVRAYWCSSEASAVVLTEKTRFTWLPWRRVGSFELHRATDWVTDEAPRIADLLHSGDTLTIRINRVLNAIPRRIAMEWVFSEQSYLLGFVERTGRHPSPEELESAVRRHQDEIDRLERYYDRAASKTARIWYFGGMLCGLVGVIALGALIPFALTPFGDIDLASTSMRRFYACFVAGAIGSMVSVMTRMRDEDRISLDYEVGELLIVLLGGFRPLLGAIFGVVAYFAIEGGVIGLTAPTGHPAFFYYALFAFLAGFSERFAHVILGKADLAVAKSGSASEASTQAPATGAAAYHVSSPALPPGTPNNGRAAPVSERRPTGSK